MLRINPLNESAALLAESKKRESVRENVYGLHEQCLRVEYALQVEREAALADHFRGDRFVGEELRLYRQRRHTHAFISVTGGVCCVCMNAVSVIQIRLNSKWGRYKMEYIFAGGINDFRE